MKRIVSIIAVAVFMLSIAAVAFAYDNPYGVWVITPSSVRTANNVKKVESGSAMVSAESQTPDGQVTWYGIRNSAGTSRVHKNAVGYSSMPTNAFAIEYKSGYGTVGNSYCLAVQNDSESTANITVWGTWQP